MKTKLLIVFFGMMLGGMIGESFKYEPDFFAIADRTFFAGWALLTYWGMETFVWKGRDL